MLWRMSKLGLLLVLFSGASGCSEDQRQKAVVAPTVPAAATPEPVRDGEALFKQYCAVCHPDGGNATDPGRTLYGSVLKRRHITTPEDIVRIMRNPLSRMIRFDAATIPDRDARAIAEYILTKFK